MFKEKICDPDWHINDIMATNSADTPLTNPTGITLEDINGIGGAQAALRLAKMFKPPLKMAKSKDVSQMKEQLRVALLKSSGEMRDLQAVSCPFV